jgi:acyl-CoA synthetase (AMP-forming)/AMP-acid ligase II/acyl carrier protein
MVMTFFQDLDRFGSNPAIIDAESGTSVSYNELESLVQNRTDALPGERQLVFIEATNGLQTIVSYLACLRAGHVVHLLESFGDVKSKALIDAYQPSLLIDLRQQTTTYQSRTHPLHPSLRLLLSTSGSTGTPKFVKLSEANIQSNAKAIADYLGLTTSERAYAHLKPYYSYGLSVIHSHLHAGAALILANKSVTEPEFLAQVKTLRATSFAGVPYTFETLSHMGFRLDDYPDLRMLTQAGGKMESHLVADFARRCRASGKAFFVMYGQTEAAPRMSYLPLAFTEQYPSSIGVAIPGGELFIVDADKTRIEQADQQGELAYRGPNVMMGYATSAEDLASDETPDCLFTGDIAYRNQDGLFFIVGRTSRFVKMFGLRINLDQIQSELKKTFPHVAVAGNDSAIALAFSHVQPSDVQGIKKELATLYHLPESSFDVRIYEAIPLLPSGKYDYRSILAKLNEKPKFHWFRKLVQAVETALELNEKHWESITEIYATLLSRPHVAPTDTFDSLGADSLSFVELSIEMESALGAHLPPEWRQMPLTELDALYARIRNTA